MMFFAVSTVICVTGLILILWIHTRYYLDIVVKPVEAPRSGPLISICIPARNEEQNIRACVGAALAQDYPNFEVIVLDDRSTDATPAALHALAAAESHLKVISGTRLPEGWAGKPHALHQAASAARGEWMCFVDADTVLAPNALSVCYAAALEARADLFTTLHKEVVITFWEKAVMPQIMTALSVAFPPRAVNDPKRRAAVSNGQFILFRRETYEAVGGHLKVHDRIVEDKALAELVKWSGHRLVIADGSRFIRTRMYTSMPEMWEGWTKNIYLGLRDHGGTLLLGSLGASLALIAAFFLPIWPFIGLAWFLAGGGRYAFAVILEALTVWGALLFARAQVARRMDISPWYAFTTPLGAAVFAALMLASAWKVITGRGVTWRGRRYHAERPVAGAADPGEN